MRTTVENALLDKPKSPAKSEKSMTSNRRSLRNLQPSATDKENLVGGGKMPSIKEHGKPTKDPFEKRSFVNEPHCSKGDDFRKKKLSSKSVQTDEEKVLINAEDLTTKGVPSVKYWKALANTKQVSLEKVLAENSNLKEKILLLEEEVKNYKIMLSESEDLVETLKELLDSPSDSEAADTEAQEDRNNVDCD